MCLFFNSPYRIILTILNAHFDLTHFFTIILCQSCICVCCSIMCLIEIETRLKVSLFFVISTFHVYFAILMRLYSKLTINANFLETLFSTLLDMVVDVSPDVFKQLC